MHQGLWKTTQTHAIYRVTGRLEPMLSPYAACSEAPEDIDVLFGPLVAYFLIKETTNGLKPWHALD